MNRLNFIPDGYHLSASYDKQQFAQDILNSAKLSITPERMLFLNAWFNAEGTNAAYNPLATTWALPGSTYFNCLKKNSIGECVAGVQNFANYYDGLNATMKTLNQPSFYKSIKTALVGNVSSINDNDPGLQTDFNTWGTTWDLFKKSYAAAGGKINISNAPIVTAPYTNPPQQTTYQPTPTWFDINIKPYVKPVIGVVIGGLILHEILKEKKQNL